MKKIIEGKRYDTESASLLACWENMYNIGDFHWMRETLYQKRTGEFFIHGEGNGLTRYAEACGTNSWTSGERIMPITLDEAREWSETHLDGDEYEKIFGAVQEDETGSSKQIHLSLDDGIIRKAQRLAGQKGMSLSAWIEKTIREA